MDQKDAHLEAVSILENCDGCEMRAFHHISSKVIQCENNKNAFWLLVMGAFIKLVDIPDNVSLN